MNWFNRLVVSTLPLVPKPIVRKLSSRYIAGNSIADAVNVVKDLQEQGCCATLDILGEYIHKKEEALEAVSGYLEALETIESEQIDCNISVKLTALGLGLDQQFALDNIRNIVDKAKSLNNFVRIDMEDSSYTSATLEIYQELRKTFDNVGVVVQAYLRRTRRDVNQVCETLDRCNFRLCKGIYIESRDIAYKDPAIINSNFTGVLEDMFRHNAYVGIATHDEKLVWHALDLIRRLKVPRERYEFQMLLGVDEQLRRIIIGAGHKLRVYVPFGKHWYGYSVRRLKENPQIAGYIVKNFFD